MTNCHLNNPTTPFMKNLKLFVYLALAILAPRFALADLVGNYTADANTLFLLHFDEAAGGTFTVNSGSKGGNFYSITEATASATPATVTTMLGAAGYLNGATNFHNCMTNPTTGYEFGYDANNSGAYQGEGTAPCPDAIAMTNLNIGFGGNTPFTLEALIRPTQISSSTGQEIICTDSSAGSRAFQFRIISSTLAFQFITGSQSFSRAIPTTGSDAFVAGTWYHVALTYDGTTATLYWTKLDPSNGAAHVLTSAALNMPASDGAVTGPLIIGNENRTAAGEQFQGSIDEVRISNVARGSGQMQFYSPLVSITQNPVSQNVDYNQPVTFSVGASSQFALGYQWRFNSNSIAGATNTSYVITNVAANNAGYYDCLITNTIAYAATSSPALLVVGAANFIANRYSFNTSSTDPSSGLIVTPDSIGGQSGTNFGNATVTGGQLVLDGTSGTFMQLPGNLFNGGNATALTVEFWATYGSNPNNVYAFAFGVTNFVTGSGIVGFNHAMYCPHNAGGQTASGVGGDPAFAQTVSAAGNLDGKTVHVAVVFDPPNKLLSIFTNGVLEAVNTNFTVNISSMNDQLSYIGKSLWAADPYLNASIDEIRIFKGALSSITIKQSNDQGPNTLLADGPAKYTLQPVNTSVPAGQPATFTAATVGYLPITYQWFKNGTLIPGATNASYSFTTSISDNGATFLTHATNVIGVTTYVTNSITATLSVFIPPTLSWLGTSDGGADNTWNTSSLDWTNDLSGGGILAFAQTNGVLFDDRSGGGSVDIEQAIIPYNIAVNTTAGYMFTSSGGLGSLNGQAAIAKTGSGVLNIDVTNNLSGPVTISGGTLQVGNNDALGSLGNSTVTNNATLSLNRGDTVLNVGNTIHGTGTLSIDGSGAVTLSGNNDFSGSTLINVGILYLASATGLGATSSGTTVASGAQLYITANVYVAEPLSLNASGDGNGALRKGGAGLTVQTAPVSLAADASVGVDSGATLVLSNSFTGGFGLTALGAGTLTLTANSSVSGFTLSVGTSGAFGANPVTVSGIGRFVLADGINLANAVNANAVSPGTATGLFMVNDNTNGTVTTVSGPLTFNVSPANGGDFQGPFASGYLNVTGPITNTATGVISSRNGLVRFSGGGNYTLFNLNQGTASLGANNGLCPATSVSIGASGGATLDLNGFNQALTGLTDGGANAELVTNSAASLRTLTLNLAASDSFNGVIAGKIALVANAGTSVLTLNATNAYTGNTTVNNGTLELAQPGLATNSTVTVASGATLQLDFGVTNQIGALVLGGASQSPGVYNSTTSPTFITGSGNLLVVPPVNPAPTNLVASVSGNTLTLSWPTDHTGWRLQVQTNSLATGLGSGWTDVPGTAAANTYNATISPANGAVFYRMVYP